MNFVPSVAWVPRGAASCSPEKLQLPPEELKRLVDETKKSFEQRTYDEEDFDEIEEDDNEETVKIKEEAISADEEEENDDFDSRYNLDSYDNDDDQNPLFTINDIAVHVDNRDDEYITDEESEGDLEEKEDFAVKDSDNLLIVGHVEDSSSILEIYVYNQEEDSFYVHHDIVLPSYPLALEWLNFHASDDRPGNYVAIGDMSPVIKIWDLDVVDILEPEYNLGQMPKKRKAKIIKGEDGKYHSDAVLSLSWNKLVRNLLASGSADSTVIIWDLEEGCALNHLPYHSNKVQALQWHPSESPFLLSGCTDGFLKLYDCRSEGESKSWNVSGEIEKVAWNTSNYFKFLCSTDQGYIHSIDMRSDKIDYSFQAHREAVTGLDISPLKPEILISASQDRTLKVWDLNQFKMLKSMKLKVGTIYAAKVAPDLDLTVAVGGDYSSNNLKVINIFEEKKDLQENQELNFQASECETAGKHKKLKKNIKKEPTDLWGKHESNFQASDCAIAGKHKKLKKNTKRESEDFQKNYESNFIASECATIEKHKGLKKKIKREKT